jgi:hypothetical protein
MASDALGEGIVYEDTLPLTWEVLEGMPAAEQLIHWSRENERVLHLVAALDEHRPSEFSDEHASSNELARLDAKLNLLLELVSDLVALQTGTPAPRPVKVNSQGLVCEVRDASPLPQTGSSVLVSLYLQHDLARPLRLPGKLEHVETLDDGGARLQLRFYDLGESVVDAFEKLIFRHHRRLIAARRGPRE